jgi:hypothetical protein
MSILLEEILFEEVSNRLPEIDEDDLWCRSTLVRLGRYVYEEGVARQLKDFKKMRKPIRLAMRYIASELFEHPTCDLEDICWKEFLELRGLFFVAYEKTLERYERRYECGICMSSLANMALCHRDDEGHRPDEGPLEKEWMGCLICMKCAKRLSHEDRCPFCRKEIVYKLRLH